MRVGCHGPCEQGRSACPTPDACRLHADDCSQIRSLKLFIAVLGVVAMLLFVGLLVDLG